LNETIANEHVQVRLLDIVDYEVVTPPSRTDNSFFQNMEQIASEEFGLPTVPMLTPAGTDLRYFRYYINTPIDCYGIYPVSLSNEDLIAIHGRTDEKVSIDELKKGLLFFNSLLESHFF